MEPATTITRRCLLKGCATAAGAAFTGVDPLRASADAWTARGDRPLVIDCHAHLHPQSLPDYRERDRRLIEAADKLGIDQLCCSILTPRRPASVEGFRACNAWLVEAIRRFPDRILGWCYVNPEYSTEAVAEIHRYVEDHGFIGVKLYNECVSTDPVVFPVVERAIELRVPILHHAGHGHHPFPDQPNISDSGHLTELGRHYPEARLICAHIGGGGDWEWSIKAMRHGENVSLDTSGSVVDAGMIEMAIDILGPDRILFGCDMSMTAGIGKMRALDINDAIRHKILGGNMQQLLAMRNHP